MSLVIGWMLASPSSGHDRCGRAERRLERRVAQKHAELERNFERLQEMERRAAVADERRRLMSEMHDGIGSQLIATVGLVERQRAATEIAGSCAEP
jgi:signal transduction histidine kinase